MGQQAVYSYLITIIEVYQKVSKKKRGGLLDHAELITKRSRKHLIKKLNQARKNGGVFPTKRSGRPSYYLKEDLLPHIKYLWEQMEKISPKRMKAALPDWLPTYKECPAHLKAQLTKMSATTLNRYLREIRQAIAPLKGLSTTSPARHMKKVPINTLDSKVKKPGYTQSDTVAHCGANAQGPFISSLTVTDIYTTWTECRAMLTKKGLEVKKQLNSIKRGLPFKLLGMNSDSGSEFLNKEVHQFTVHANINFTRSRPYKKNDNCYVEQKNFTHVRELFGYERLDRPEPD